MADRVTSRLAASSCSGAAAVVSTDGSPSMSGHARRFISSISRFNSRCRAFQKRLRLVLWSGSSGDLAYLSRLTNLRTLALDIITSTGDTETHVLSHLPVLPRLEQLDLHHSSVSDDDLDRLAGFERLEWLDLSETSVFDVGLAKLAPLDSLEELGIGELVATAAAFESLASLKNLRAVHIAGWGDDRNLKRRGELVFPGVTDTDQLRPAKLVLDDGYELPVFSGELDDLNRSLAMLRQSHPGIIIDAKYEEFAERGNLDQEAEDLGVFVRRWLDERLAARLA